MAYGLFYKFIWQSDNGTEFKIHILKDGYSGAATQRALGGAPLLRRERNGNICGTSLEFDAECRVDGGDWEDVELAINGEDFTISAQLYGLDYRYSHNVELVVYDSVVEASKTENISKGIPVFDWGENDFAFHVPVQFVATDGTVFTLDIVDGNLSAVIK